MTPSQDDPVKNIVAEAGAGDRTCDIREILIREPTFEQIKQRMEESIKEHVPEYPVNGTAPPFEPLESIMQFFAYEHLPPALQEVSRHFCHLADYLVRTLPRGPERSVALRKLLEGKDAAVRARMAGRP
jgi:hypothetical protein